jgi:putative MATE family efflux protein
VNDEEPAPIPPERPLGPVPAAALTGSLPTQVVRLAAPATLHYLMHTVVFFTDRLMLGRHGAVDLAATAVVGPVTWSVSSIFMIFNVGTLAVIARDTGAGRLDQVKVHAATALWMAACLGTVVGLAAWLGTPVMVRLFGVTPAVAEAAQSYQNVLMPGLVAMFLTFTLTSIYQASGDTVTPMAFSVVANAVNIGGNYVLIFGNLGFPELGMRGAAVSSLASLSLLSLLLLATLLVKKKSPGLRPRDLLGFSMASLKRQVVIALPAMLERILFHGGFLCYVRVVTALGELSMAAHQALIAIQSMVFLPGEGFAVAAGVIMGQKLGAGKPDEAARGARLATYMAMGILVSAGIVFFCFPGPLISLFLPRDGDPAKAAEILRIGVPALRIGACEGVFLAVVFVLSGGLRGAGDTRTPMFVTVIGTWFVRLPAVMLLGLPPEQTLGLGLGLGLKGIWVGSLIDWVVRFAIILWAFRRGRWRRIGGATSS